MIYECTSYSTFPIRAIKSAQNFLRWQNIYSVFEWRNPLSYIIWKSWVKPRRQWFRINSLRPRIFSEGRVGGGSVGGEEESFFLSVARLFNTSGLAGWMIASNVNLRLLLCCSLSGVTINYSFIWASVAWNVPVDPRLTRDEDQRTMEHLCVWPVVTSSRSNKAYSIPVWNIGSGLQCWQTDSLRTLSTTCHSCKLWRAKHLLVLRVTPEMAVGRDV